MSGYFVEVFLCFSLTYIVIGYFVKVFLVLHGLRILWLIICRSFSGSAWTTIFLVNLWKSLVNLRKFFLVFHRLQFFN